MILYSIYLPHVFRVPKWQPFTPCVISYSRYVPQQPLLLLDPFTLVSSLVQFDPSLFHYFLLSLSLSQLFLSDFVSLHALQSFIFVFTHVPDGIL